MCYNLRRSYTYLDFYSQTKSHSESNLSWPDFKTMKAGRFEPCVVYRVFEPDTFLRIICKIVGFEELGSSVLSL